MICNLFQRNLFKKAGIFLFQTPHGSRESLPHAAHAATSYSAGSLLQLFTYHFPNRQDGEKTIPAGKNQTRLSLTTPHRSSILHFIDKKIGRTSAGNPHLPESSIYGPPEN
jgi:hypothetical protein